MKILHLAPAYEGFAATLFDTDNPTDPAEFMKVRAADSMSVQAQAVADKVAELRIPLVIVETAGIGLVFADMFVDEARKLTPPPLVVSHFGHGHFPAAPYDTRN